MKLLFCSKYSGQVGTTSNLSAIATYTALNRHLKLFLMQAQYEKNYLDHAFLGERQKELEIQGNGIDSLVRIIKSEPITKEAIDSCSVNLYQNRLHLLPGTAQNNLAMYEAMICPMLIYCMNAIAANYDVTYVDLGLVTDWKCNPLLDQADVIVLNVCQNQSVIADSFGMDSKYREKIFYLIGNYDPVSKYNINYIQKKYKVPKRRIGMIPYNSMYRDAFSDGTVIKLMTQIYHSTKDEMNYYFVRGLRVTVEKLMLFSEKCKSPKKSEFTKVEGIKEPKTKWMREEEARKSI